MINILLLYSKLCWSGQNGFIETVNGVQIRYRFVIAVHTGDTQEAHHLGGRPKLGVKSENSCCKCHASQYELTDHISTVSYAKPTSAEQRRQYCDSLKTFAEHKDVGYEPTTMPCPNFEKAAGDPLTSWILDCNHLMKNVAQQEFEHIQYNCITSTNYRALLNAYLMDFYISNDFKNPLTTKNLATATQGRELVDLNIETALRFPVKYIYI